MVTIIAFVFLVSSAKQVFADAETAKIYISDIVQNSDNSVTVIATIRAGKPVSYYSLRVAGQTGGPTISGTLSNLGTVKFVIPSTVAGSGFHIIKLVSADNVELASNGFSERQGQPLYISDALGKPTSRNFIDSVTQNPDGSLTVHALVYSLGTASDYSLAIAIPSGNNLQTVSISGSDDGQGRLLLSRIL